MKKIYVTPLVEFDEIEELCNGMVTASQQVNTPSNDIYNPITLSTGSNKNDNTIFVGDEDETPEGLIP